MTRYLFYCNDGFGLGHARRTTLIASAVLARDPAARVVVVTGAAAHLPWLENDARIEVVRVPPLQRGPHGGYRRDGLTFQEVVSARARRFTEEVVRNPPDVVLVDRHPHGRGGELRQALELARDAGAALVLGLRDILDEPRVIAREIASQLWSGGRDLYHRTLVFGAPHVADHVAEYGLPMTPEYCGWIVAPEPAVDAEPRLLAVAAGGGVDGGQVFELAHGLLELRPSWRGVIAAGPYSSALSSALATNGLTGRLQVFDSVSSCATLFSQAAAVVCMAGYNSTMEALAVGRRPILVPRRRPGREQVIRAGRLASLGLADVVDEGAGPDEVSWLLDRDRTLSRTRLDEAGIRLDGADTAAGLLAELVGSRSLR